LVPIEDFGGGATGGRFAASLRRIACTSSSSVSVGREGSGVDVTTGTAGVAGSLARGATMGVPQLAQKRAPSGTDARHAGHVDGG